MAKVIDEKVKQIKEAIKKFGEETVDTIVTRKKENRIFYYIKKARTLPHLFYVILCTI